MDLTQFDAMTCTLSSLPSRRDVLRGLTSVGLGLGALALPGVVAAKAKQNGRGKGRGKGKGKKKHKKRPQPQPQPQPLPQPPLVFNAFGCVEVGQACRGDSANCCSGLCEGPAPASEDQPDTSRCVAHDTGTCQQTATGICLSDAPPNISCNNNNACRCFTTTAGSNVCGAFVPAACAECQRDADCATLGFPAGSACTPFFEGFCGGQCASGMVCIPPCGVELPPPPPDM